MLSRNSLCLKLLGDGRANQVHSAMGKNLSLTRVGTLHLEHFVIENAYLLYTVLSQNPCPEFTRRQAVTML